ncbi:iron(III) transport system permease protein [Methylobacterium sp. PvP062]|jgi:iron(III) transport system permease protein|uniref:Iron(III) transport system permease protein n=1 Tax=Methylobacterium radiotolerans TaxID=31998 RepID=A0ABV2NSC6_9HYPH|nr:MULTISPECIES: iron ABC transporter permease [Methylobacterium]MCX7336458.1 iron ABC transporter permease [Hyphomicrobiales bacterium]GAN51145.1 binding-protein-dependent transport system inner membrane protein [Methylobacterium sp. ME121]KTS05126.1 iron ABC transporter permease [Methylobacterium radiotolerans]KTS43723.1 iron ABC transporter permease [Methylobacterium radiotolerans]KZC02268.1 putative 2-aminoethylphosphonate transport system permease protein PhnU [Methylobacterium radiotoler
MAATRGLGWAGAAALAALLLSPVISLGIAALGGGSELWPHLAAYVLPQAIRDTALLLAGVGLLVIGLGTGAAWLVSAFDFPGRRVLEGALLLPLAMPTYVVAYAYLDLSHPLGPLQAGLRSLLGLSSPRDLPLPDLRSLPGCILLLGFVLYPYVYLPTRALFLMQAGTLLEAARVLGAGPFRSFLRVALPLARPAVALGTGLALMEALNDVGAAEFLGVRTLTVQVYATWVNRSDLPGAAQIALVMLACVVALVGLERLARGGRGYAGSARRNAAVTRRRLSGWRAGTAVALGATPVVLGFLLPAGHLACEAWRRVAGGGWPDTLAVQTGNTILYASLATGVTVVVGLLVAAAPFLLSARAGRALIRAAGLGYAMPGTVLAVGLLGPLALIDSGLLEAGFATVSVGLGTGAALVIAYALRFLTVTVGASEAGLARIPHTISDAARVLGRGRLATLATVQIPLAWPAMLSGGLLAFVDIAKELPVTLLLRPLNVETLSTFLYGEAARGTYEDGAVAAVLIVMIGLVPVTLLLRIDENAVWRRR